jgi:hypothetical protein
MNELDRIARSDHHGGLHGFSSPGGILQNLWIRVIGAIGGNYTMIQTRINDWCAAKGRPEAPMATMVTYPSQKQRRPAGTHRGPNLNRALQAPMTWKTFLSGIEALGFVTLSIQITLKRKSGDSVIVETTVDLRDVKIDDEEMR